MSIIGAIGGIAGSVLDSMFGNKAAQEQADLQKEFAKNGIRWKVKDAEAAGIHPLYALGAQTTAYSPISVGGTDFATGGQNLGSAVQAMTTPKEKMSAFETTVQNLTLQKMGLENDVLASQLRMMNQPGRGPGMPVGRMLDGQGSTPQQMSSGGAITIDVNPANTPASDWSNQYGEPGDWIGGAANLVDDALRTLTGASGPADLGKQLRDYLVREAPRWIQQPPKRSKNPRGYGGY